jgi:hypothetical protein
MRIGHKLTSLKASSASGRIDFSGNTIRRRIIEPVWLAIAKAAFWRCKVLAYLYILERLMACEKQPQYLTCRGIFD